MRPPGRPPLDPESPSVPVNVRVSERAYDALYARATAAHVTVPALIRQALEPLIGTQSRPDEPDR